ncbi:MAG: hypothetical protein PHW03_05400 [Eubacteriales bacterium]|nr:hypothetical protein [Eubacteriales bacterium]
MNIKTGERAYFRGMDIPAINAAIKAQKVNMYIFKHTIKSLLHYSQKNALQ